MVKMWWTTYVFENFSNISGCIVHRVTRCWSATVETTSIPDPWGNVSNASFFLRRSINYLPFRAQSLFKNSYSNSHSSSRSLQRSSAGEETPLLKLSPHCAHLNFSSQFPNLTVSCFVSWSKLIDSISSVVVRWILCKIPKCLNTILAIRGESLLKKGTKCKVYSSLRVM